MAGSRAGWEVRLFEQAAAFGEVGAGLQLGPNATRLLGEWGLLDAVRARAAAPRRLVVRDAHRGHEIAALALGADIERRYGAPYLTAHRADLHAVLLEAAQGRGARLHTGTRLAAMDEDEAVVRLHTECGRTVEGEALAVADGLWSTLRVQLLGGQARPRAFGHLAYRGLLPAADVADRGLLRAVTAWLGPDLHAVTYPVRSGELLNVVCFVEGRVEGDPTGWDREATAARLQAALRPVRGGLRALVDAMPGWRLWVLHDRAPLGSAQEMARGRAALLGDAAHPMRPYLAQGAAMALEDAGALGRALAMADGRLIDVPTALRCYAQGRWQRCARVQRRSLRNGRIFHAGGLVRWGRDASLRLLGARLLDMPWLYGPL
ncbi:salicylate hydroxylase (Salicylate 1-monooxygenase)-like protein [Ramlibacter tataouinensis TTB310]|uniref:Salicylate hydroxylase (Salicylate 1-monooxygenase)-like protein n=1 Tax=Ramlibacter tataouinensis (strain ATCC BAA-407 / DSM 14655 / LMG 21543 / TTB310) TaxID=365046 RepID=F5Y558_RAMTT|nr:salicylate hydroxylase (Salicylate 1-monooxygenase)-like protein [Ramlibacter tataouinensis TTB310]